MRGTALAVAAIILLAGCARPPAPAEAAEPADDGPSRTARAGAGGADDNRTVVVLGSAQGGATQPGTYPLPLDVPAGGAEDVDWSLEVVPAAAFTLDGVEGPGCTTTGWHSSFTTSGTTGGCDSVPAGPHEWAFTLNAPVASYHVEVRGRVWDPSQGSSNATER